MFIDKIRYKYKRMYYLMVCFFNVFDLRKLINTKVGLRFYYVIYCCNKVEGLKREVIYIRID